MKYHLYAVLLFVATVSPVFGESNWVVIAREGQCTDLKRLAKWQNLPKTPSTPEDFAQMMSDRGYKVTVGFPEHFPAEFSGRAVEVKVREGMTLNFVREEICQEVGNSSVPRQ